MNLIVIDDYHQNPDEIRDFALGLEYNEIGNYPGFRAHIESEDFCEMEWNKLSNAIGQEIIPPNLISDHPLRFQWSHDGHVSWIHHDIHEHWRELAMERDVEIWAALVFLTPDAPIKAGTAIYRNKTACTDRCAYETMEEIQRVYPSGNQDMEHWDVSMYVGNVYNRFLAYPARYYHRNICSFGTHKRDGRLTELFFYGVENDS